ncbi:hypothetical protein IVB12_34640 [Bradyrhizobium sp. 179]|uniref:hypothetical protein n=1 Tax=Bradyrhizobium sp. 179 TaxID=2782648 RepID=UPI001FFA5910|nr:hypothetical protein [Bradyrhizobium sp. 179]MCK1546926.1 hypothetical protein [Bradyrhizobium sp. 179]
MTALSALPDVVVVDVDAGQTSGDTTISYKKDPEDDLWELVPGRSWSRVNPHVRTGLGDIADKEGSWSITLVPGQSYELGVFERGHGPLSIDPIRRATLLVFCLVKKPRERGLITDENRGFGGTWYFHQIHTRVPTSVVSFAVSRTPPVIDADGIPHPVSPEGDPSAPFIQGMMDHKADLLPLFPGNRYFFSAVVVDSRGDWEVRQDQFTTLRRVLNVEFPTLHIFNDGDPFDHGEASFTFRVFSGPVNQPTVIKDFDRATQDIDDWGETDRPYAMSFAHFGTPLAVADENEMSVSVASWGVEHDGFLEEDEAASNWGTRLPLPVGRNENVVQTTFLMDCPTSNGDFHYGVNVRWSVSYVP